MIIPSPLQGKQSRLDAQGSEPLPGGVDPGVRADHRRHEAQEEANTGLLPGRH